MLPTFHGKTTPSLVQNITHVESVRRSWTYHQNWFGADGPLQIHGDITLDVIFTSHPSYEKRCKPLPPISAKGDHDIVLSDTAHQLVRARPKRRTIYSGRKLTQKVSGRLSVHTAKASSPQPSVRLICGKTRQQSTKNCKQCAY